MTKSTVPQFAQRDSSFSKTCARNATAAKLKRLGFHLTLQRTRQFLRTESPLDWVIVLLLVAAGIQEIAAISGFGFANWLRQAIYFLVAISLPSLALGYLAQKLGLIDWPFFRSKAPGKSLPSDIVNSRRAEEIPITSCLAAAPEHQSQSGEQTAVSTDSAIDWQAVEIENRGKIRFHFSDKLPG